MTRSGEPNFKVSMLVFTWFDGSMDDSVLNSILLNSVNCSECVKDKYFELDRYKYNGEFFPRREKNFNKDGLVEFSIKIDFSLKGVSHEF